MLFLHILNTYKNKYINITLGRATIAGNHRGQPLQIKLLCCKLLNYVLYAILSNAKTALLKESVGDDRRSQPEVDLCIAGSNCGSNRRQPSGAYRLIKILT